MTETFTVAEFRKKAFNAERAELLEFIVAAKSKGCWKKLIHGGKRTPNPSLLTSIFIIASAENTSTIIQEIDGRTLNRIFNYANAANTANPLLTAAAIAKPNNLASIILNLQATEYFDFDAYITEPHPVNHKSFYDVIEARLTNPNDELDEHAFVNLSHIYNQAAGRFAASTGKIIQPSAAPEKTRRFALSDSRTLLVRAIYNSAMQAAADQANTTAQAIDPEVAQRITCGGK